jgi:hypothetical protein
MESKPDSRFLFCRVFLTRTGIHFARKRSSGQTRLKPLENQLFPAAFLFAGKGATPDGKRRAGRGQRQK